MKKIGISTINDYNNYGNRLQNYALQEILKNLNTNVVTVVNKTTPPTYLYEKESRLARLQRWRNLPFYEMNMKAKNKIWYEINKKKIIETKSIRYDKFIEFTKSNIAETDFIITEGNLRKDELRDFDYFVTGSDQVWNPNFRHGSFIDFLTYASPEKRISYAASFGVSEIPEINIKNYSQWLSEMSYISVREQAGAEIVKKLTRRDVPVLADPTLILPKEKWLTVSKRAKNRPDSPYLLTYFLGRPPKETRRKLKRIAAEKNMTIINLGDITEKDTYETGPREFLDYINNASAFFTDSFHGIIFSIIFQTPFIVYERMTPGSSMYSRIETILHKFNMKNREAKGFNEDIFSMDFSGTLEVLKKEYEKSIDYLKDALRIEE